MTKQPYNNRGWIEWREPETSPDFAEVSPKVFREMKQRYEDEGKSVSISGDRFYGAVLVVDNVKMAKRIKPEVWEPCDSSDDSSESQTKYNQSSETSIKIDYCTSDYITGLVCAVVMTFPVAFMMYLIFAAIDWFLFGATSDLAYDEFGKPYIVYDWYWYLCIHWWYIWTFVNIGIWTYIYRFKYTDSQKYQYILDELNNLTRRRR